MLAVVFALAPAIVSGQQARGQEARQDEAAVALLDHLAGRWVMRGTLGGKSVTHDVDAQWMLKREYLQFHEVSREKDAAGASSYEAVVLMGWDAKTSEYGCLWLDSTGPWDFTARGLARGKKTGDTIPLVIPLSSHEALHTTFAYDARSNSWRLTIDDVTDGKSDRFGDVRLTRQ